jgi:hypothetical protein
MVGWMCLLLRRVWDGWLLARGSDYKMVASESESPPSKCRDAGMPGKVNLASAFLLLVNYVSPALAFRYQGRVSQVPLHGYG